MPTDDDKSSPKKGNDPGGPKKNVGSFISKKTKQRIFVYAKNGESDSDAWQRVRHQHELLA
jgi:hypothetical protein